MKKTLLLALTMLLAGAVSAQNEMAILSHNGTLTDYYGTTALQAALSAAVSGDIVTVSSGTFSISGIPEGVTVRGNGFEEDLVAGGIMPTIVNYSSNSGRLIINKSAVVEGIKFSYNVFVCDSVHLSKCYFCNNLYPYRSYNNNEYYDATNLEIVNCYINYIQNNNMQNSIITNSIIGNYGKTTSNGGRVQVNNCIIGDINYNLLNATTTPDVFTGCIFRYQGLNNNSQRNQTNCYNCIGLCFDNNNNPHPFFQSAVNYVAFQQMTEEEKVAELATKDTTHHNYNATSFGELFETLTSVTAAQFTDYSLTPVFDTLANRLNIGVYKGMVPYTPFVNRPRYVRTNAAPRTTSDGKLSVDIQVVTVED